MMTKTHTHTPLAVVASIIADDDSSFNDMWGNVKHVFCKSLNEQQSQIFTQN